MTLAEADAGRGGGAERVGTRNGAGARNRHGRGTGGGAGRAGADGSSLPRPSGWRSSAARTPGTRSRCGSGGRAVRRAHPGDGPARPVDLETLDTLITAGFAAHRAQAVRWALARIRERPAYVQLRGPGREIETLKSQF